ncbi:hypothetical protein RND71_025202 [Anisodus tanguticus]|uniref:Beta-hexosaminidase n=1 Tax=Anisodus tanguticus TaxID=243964 RepID=A0AAE1VA65_9SOLA|nr:hypothetical protein RND71_025202 [Anisodus tanguticus]
MMGKLGLQSVLFLVVVHILVVSAAADIKNLKIWPMPLSVSYGHRILQLSNEFVLKTESSKYPDASGILKEGFSRLLDVIKVAHVVDANASYVGPSPVLKGIQVVILSPSDELQYGIDESYNLTIPDKGNPAYAYLTAKTVYGALHGLQTFSQACHFNFTTRTIEVHQVPWAIVDRPRFSFRGLLIGHSPSLSAVACDIEEFDDVTRSIPMPVGSTSWHDMHTSYFLLITNTLNTPRICSMQNVLHWHIVDTQSFPLEIPSYPKLWNGAYSSSERYAERRGINVLAELDVPGHAQSWGVGYPSLWPSKDCQQPLDVSNDFTFKVIDVILSDFSKIFKYRFVHLGGDEVDTSCWTLTPHISKWLKQHRLNGTSAYEYFVLRAQKIALSHGYEIINWEETFNNFGNKLSPKTIVHNWLGGGVAQEVTAAGLRCIVSNQDKWYLDHIDTTWQDFYSNEPLTNITNSEQQRLVIGGEVCMWGEHIDGSNIETTIWPRAAAAAERLWTAYDNIAKNPNQITRRLAYFRCLLNQRGVASGPLTGGGRAAPEDPGSCYEQ